MTVCSLHFYGFGCDELKYIMTQVCQLLFMFPWHSTYVLCSVLVPPYGMFLIVFSLNCLFLINAMQTTTAGTQTTTTLNAQSVSDFSTVMPTRSTPMKSTQTKSTLTRSTSHKINS